MSFPELPGGDPKDPKDPRKPSMNRIIVWVLVGGAGLYFFITGLVGVIAKGG
ncbi:hypothetical protein [Homoserinibacter sp. YIM 151385]|uniref:hypothetical protein n=1 Tax=Homoserinibacter sp. YIM 151385 TaxID=2985506 RepID=UPI0022F06F38|nr:hypothetical protein [Homoserinibacter sp. YIM 151385]WBU37562.1 hypothetical protein OF852_11665 [Homoserinibacter sp. YIM 151385]